MAELSTKPYLIRAIHEWCTDSGYRPHIAVVVDESTVVPREFVRNGEIVLNVSAAATNRLRITNEAVEFEARFGGIARSVSVPIDNVTAIYAQETGHGMAFDVPKPLALVPEPARAGEDASGPSAPVLAGVEEAGNRKAGDEAATSGSGGGGDREAGVAPQAAGGAGTGASARVRRRPKLTAVPAPAPAVPEAKEAAAPKSPKRRRKDGPVKADEASAPLAEETPPSGGEPEPRPPSGPPRLTRVK